MALADNPAFLTVRSHADQMLSFGRDPSDDPSPLFAPIVDPIAKAVCIEPMAPPPGIRINDFPTSGNNLMHEIPFLWLLEQLTELTGQADYAQAMHEVFAFYPHHCPHPETGLFPWGEHAQWSFKSRRILAHALRDHYIEDEKMIIHDHLHHAHGWFWEKMWAESPEAVVNFAHGLDFHIMDAETAEHNRHAPLAGVHWNDIPYRGKGKDFARHAGFFIFDVMFAWKGSQDPALLDWARRKLAHHMDRRLPSGLIAGCSRTPTSHLPGHHDLFALALYDTAQMLGPDTPVGTEFQAAADDLFAVRATPDGALPPLRDDLSHELAWYHIYGGLRPAAPASNVIEQVYHRTANPTYAERLLDIAAWHRQVTPPPVDFPVSAWTMVKNLDVNLAAYAVSGDATHLERASELGQWAIERFAPTGLILGCINMHYQPSGNSMWLLPHMVTAEAMHPGLYLSGCGAPSLARSLFRLAMLQEGLTDPGPDPHNR